MARVDKQNGFTLVYAETDKEIELLSELIKTDASDLFINSAKVKSEDGTVNHVIGIGTISKEILKEIPNNTDSKYYTPTIEEFHVGFEYERIEDDFDDNESWIKDILQFEFGWIEIPESFAKTKRVKHLDKEDIESLGYNCYKEHPGSTTKEFESVDGKTLITFDAEFSNKWNCTISDKSDFILFHGYIKNKLELKVLLKQLNIEL